MALLKRLKMPFGEEAPQSTNVPSGPRSAGDELRRQREALGLDLGVAAVALRIKPGYLAALEAGRPDQLPGAVYAIGFLRAYADYLGLDGAEMLRRFKRESLLLGAKPDLAFPIPLGERGIPGGGMLLVALILATCAYGGWFYLSTDDGPRPERVAAIPGELLPNAEQFQARSTALRPVEVIAPSQPSAASTGAPGSPGTIEAGSGSARPPAATPTVATPAATGSAPDAPRGVVIRATVDSWIEIRDTRRAVLFERVLKAGESYSAPDQPGLSMRTSNAGGLEITVDGIPAPSIGRRGMVRRNVVLDAQALLAGSAVRN
jgi:cytoskeleton protein RodZ